MSTLLERVNTLEWKLDQALNLLRERVPWGWGDVATAARLLGTGRETLQGLLKEAWEEADRPELHTEFLYAKHIPARWCTRGPTRPVFQVYIPSCQARKD